MNLDCADAVAKAVLYEGYLLYPYRPSSLKNQQRWSFGAVFPHDYSAAGGGDPSVMQTQFLVRGSAETVISGRIRFLHLVRREGGAPGLAPWDEAIEREVLPPSASLGQLARRPLPTPIVIAASREVEPGHDGGEAAVEIVRTAAALEGSADLSAELVAEDVWRLTLRIENTTPLPQAALQSRDAAQRFAFASLHAVFGVEGGAFLSLTDPPDAVREAAEACENQGVWPVLVGREGQTDTLLASPIILPDYPEIAPESAGDLFDGCEIDEILTLRILTMTDEEKREMAAADPRARALLERTEALTEVEMEAMHGALRRPGGAHTGGAAGLSRGSPQAKPRLTSIALKGGGRVSVGDQVRLRPKGGADIMDVVLSGMIAIIEGIERDFENRIHLAVTIADDPGREFGTDRFPGHRFFYGVDEVEPVEAEAAA